MGLNNFSHIFYAMQFEKCKLVYLTCEKFQSRQQLGILNMVMVSPNQVVNYLEVGY